jgi:hypothetical protein
MLEKKMLPAAERMPETPKGAKSDSWSEFQPPRRRR